MTGPQTARFKIVALYKFVALPDFAALQPLIHRFCTDKNIRGLLLLAPEGFNGTLAGSPTAIDRFVAWLADEPVFAGRFEGAEIKYSFAESAPFRRLKVRKKAEIVTLDAPEADPTCAVGTYVAPKQWNALIARPDVTLVDTRNNYEFSLGTFAGALNPKTTSFTGFKRFAAHRLDPQTSPVIAMFCTGGIRCEKASAYLLAHGFEQVFHLKGGILAYLETVPPGQSQWVGECFVFDERVSVTHGLVPGKAVLCRGCRHPLMPADLARPDYLAGVKCHHCAGAGAKKHARAAQRQFQIDLATARGQAHLGTPAGPGQ
jgi:UPF0176 protein